MSLKAWFLVLTVIVAPFPLQEVRTPAPPFRVAASSFEEHYLEKVPVSGGGLVGIQYLGKQELTQKSLWARVPPEHTSSLCVSVVTDDGRYSAVMTSKLDRRASGLVTLDFPTNRLSDLATYGSERIALLGVLRDSCADRVTEANPWYVPLSWSASVDLSKLTLIVNSGGTDVQSFPAPVGPSKDCRTADIRAKRIAFDTYCDISDSQRQDSWTGYFVRLRPGETPRQFPIRIWTHR
jgi:hypothetical protein